jgi:hypothetical protein
MLGAMHDQDATTDRSAQINRIAWLVTFVVPLVLTALLLTVKTAQATEPPSPPAALEEVFEAEFEEAIELTPEDACFEAEEAFEVGELEEAELEKICEEEVSEPGPRGKGDSAPGAGECPLRSANANATARNDRLKLTIGYTTNTPTNAAFEVKLGPAKLATLQRHLGRSGVIRFNKPMPENPRGKLTVRIKLPAGAAGCPSRRLVLFPR